MITLRPAPTICLLALLALTTSGCANGDAMGIRFEPEDSSPVQAPHRLPVPVRIGVRRNDARYARFHDLVLRGLKANGSFSEVAIVEGRDHPAGLDYLIDLDYELETGSRWYNYFTIFPGFVVFACHWAHLRWDFDLTTKLRLRRGDGTEVARFVRRDEHEMAYTGAGYAIGSDMGWLGVLFLPAFGSPFVTGFVALFNGDQPIAYRRRFFVSESGHDWGVRIGHMVAHGIEADLKAGALRLGPQTDPDIIMPAPAGPSPTK